MSREEKFHSKKVSLKANYHTHTYFCDGLNTPEEMAEAAVRMGMEHLGFSGHVDVSPEMDVPAYLAEVRRIQEKYRDRIEILCGGELDNLYPDRSLAGFDYLIGSVHHFRAGDEVLAIDWTEEILLHLLRDYYGGDGYRLCKTYFRTVAETYGKGKCDFIGHYDLITRFSGALHYVDENDRRYLEPAYETMEYLVREGLPLEINTKLADRGKIYPGKALLKKLRELDGEILLSSDAHRAEDLMHGFEQGLEAARICGFDHVLILRREGKRIRFADVPI